MNKDKGKFDHLIKNLERKSFKIQSLITNLGAELSYHYGKEIFVTG